MAEDEIGAIVARLRAELREGASPSHGAEVNGGGTAPLASRAEAERLWAVLPEQPAGTWPGWSSALARWGWRGVLKRLFTVPVKRVVRRLIRWYVDPVVFRQREFNAALLKLTDGLSARTDAEVGRLQRSVGEALERLQESLEARLGELEQRLGSTSLEELDERMSRLERVRRFPAPSAAAQKPVETQEEVGTQGGFPDYFAFESRMRGSTESVRERQRRYVEDFRDAAPVLDAGCGRGEFLELLREAGVEARGVDLDPEMVAFCVAAGLAVEQGDVVRHLEGLEDGSLGGIFAAQLVEHLPLPVLTRFLEFARLKLRPEGVLVAETINPLSLFALRYYHADPTHAQPLVPETLALLARQCGLAKTEIRYLNELGPEERLRAVELPPDPSFDVARDALEHDVDRLNDVLFGPQDYALVARA